MFRPFSTTRFFNSCGRHFTCFLGTAYAQPISMVTNMTTTKKLQIGNASIVGLKNILLDEAMRLEHNNRERAQALMEEIMHGMEEETEEPRRTFRPPRPKRGV